MDNPIKVYHEFLSRRTINALERSDIYTIKDLVALPEEEIMKMPGIGEKGFHEIEELFNNVDPDVDLTSAWQAKEVLSLHEWFETALKQRTAKMLIERYGLMNEQPKKAAVLAEELGITKSRVGQILERARKKLESAILVGKINPDINQKILEYAEANTRIESINDLDENYNNAAIVRLYASVVEDYDIYKSPRLKSEWVTKNPNQIDEWVEVALGWLNSQIAFVPINKLSEESGVRKDIIYDLASTKIEGDHITLVNGYRKNGIDRSKLIYETLRESVEPMNVYEVSEKTNLSVEILRGYLHRIPGVANVGNSTFALEEFGYTNKNSEELILDYLKEWNSPRHMNDIIKYVLKYRTVSPGAVSAIIYNKPEVFTRFSDGYVALAEWGYESDARKRKVYEVPIREAVMSVLKEAERSLSNRDILERIIVKFGDKTTNSITTIGMTTAEMEKVGLLERLGTGTYYYKMKE